MKAVKPRKCGHCKAPYVPRSSFQDDCGLFECVKALAAKRKERAEKREARAIRVYKRDALEALKSVPVLTRETQDAFNLWVRLRDERAQLPCVSCGELNPFEPGVTGGVWDAGHYRTVGACPELRFEPLNVWRQCKSCNSGVWRRGGRVVRAHDPERADSIRKAFRATLVERIGIEKVEWLDGPHAPKFYRGDDLRTMKRDLRVQIRELKCAA